MLKIVRKFKSLFIAGCTVLVLTSLVSAQSVILASDKSGEVLPAKVDFSQGQTFGAYSYFKYMEEHKNLAAPDYEYIKVGSDYAKLEDTEVSQTVNFDGNKNAIYWGDQEGSVYYDFDIQEAGKYRIEIGYLPETGHSGNMEFEVSINGIVPFDEAAQISLNRIWIDAGPIKRDNRDNDLRPMQIDSARWMKTDLRDREGVFSGSFGFALNKGLNRIGLKKIRETMTIGWLRVYNEAELPDYDEYKKSLFGHSPARFTYILEAEKALYKSDPGLYPVADRISPLTKPYSPSKVRLNSIGGQTFRFPGQWIEWEIDVPEDGDYIIGMRSRQDQLRGLYSHRRIYIDGVVPFKELSEIKYGFDTNWKMDVLKNGDETYIFSLKKGKHSIRMEATTGSLGATIDAVQGSIRDLNILYRKIIMITGVTPDIYRDYDITKEIPEISTEFARIAKLYDDELSRIEKMTGRKTSAAALLKEMSVQLKSISKDPESITERLERFKNNVSALSAWLLEIRQQPLEIDYIWVASPGTDLPRSEANAWEKIVHEVKAFVFSFFENYDQIGNVSEGNDVLEVWVGSGRDQAQIVKALTDDQFTSEYGIGVNISLVQGTLLEATMAGKGPDIALNVARFLPVDLAVRGALVNIDKFDGFADMKKDFQSTAFIPYTYRNKVYAAPETQEFNMLFYRKDIFAELGIEPPEDWDDLYKIIPLIERKNMDLGIPSLIPQAQGDSYTPFPRTFGTLLLQRGYGYYTDDMSRTTFDTQEAADVFKMYVDLYREHGLPVYYDFVNRFRTGEIPIGIASYSVYNVLYIFAPEIRNLWEMVPIPGTRQPDGSLDRSEEGYGSGCVIFSKVSDEEKAFDFVRWWTSEKAQIVFGREMESLMGPAARQPTANLKAFENLPWSAREIKALKTQWNSVKEQPEIPGSYFVSRNLNNAILEAVFENGNTLATLEKYNKYINEEITRKRIEFGDQTFDDGDDK